MIYAITPITIEASQGFTSVDQDQRALTTPTARIGYALGPQALRLPQDWPYNKRWAAWANSAGVMLKPVPDPTLVWTPDETGAQCSLFSAPIYTNHLTLAFDQVSSEVIAWQNGTSIEVRRIFSGALQITSWIGFGPLAVNNGLFNTDVPSGDTDVVIYYLKRGRNSIFARIQRDNYGVEYVAANVPFQPIDLVRSWYDTGTRIHRLEALDSGWRSAILATAPYPVAVIVPPSPPPEILATTADVGFFTHTISGIHYEGTVTSNATDRAALTHAIIGAMSPAIVSTTQNETIALTHTITGVDALQAIATSQSDVGALTHDISGATALQAISTGLLPESVDLTHAISGTYS